MLYDPNRGITNLWRYKDYFQDPAVWPKLTVAVPFLNGGLFDCLDQKFTKGEGRENVLLDGFSDNPDESTHLPNDLFFGPERSVNLSIDYGEADNLPNAKRASHNSTAQLADLRRKFEELYAPSHSLRAALQKLHTLDPIRIIEGKA